MAEPNWIACPLCAERVPAQNVKCKHCGSTLQRAEFESEGPQTADLAPTQGVGPAAIFVLLGLFLGYAAGAALEGWRHSLIAVLGAGIGLIVYRLLDGPLAHLRAGKPTPEPSPGAAAEEPASEAEG